LRKHAADGPGDHPQSGVDFTVNGVTKTTDANGQACFDGLTFGSYTVHETTPAGYSGEADKTVVVDNTAKCTDSPFGGETVTFHNTPLTNITLSVDSQIDGGTSSTIDCGGGATGTTGPNGDGSVSRNNLAPGTYTCTVVIDP
jgi:prealbumin domain-containing protein